MTDEEILAWIHEDYDRTLILQALEGTAFLEKWRPARLIKQFKTMIDPDKLPANLAGLHKRGLIRSKIIFLGDRKREFWRGAMKIVYRDRVNGWRLTPKGAVILDQLTKVVK